MRKYEIMYIVNASLEEAKRQEIIEAIHAVLTDNGGSITSVDEWGVREFAYRIEDMTKGYYLVVNFEADNDSLNEFERLIHINANVVRYMIINKEE